jgi:hypothetical protein
MGTKKLDERCQRIFDFFCQLDSEGNYCREVPIVNLIFPNSLYKQLEEPFDKGLLWPIAEVAFTIGYVIGQSFEITFPEAKGDIEAIKKVIKDKQLLPYLPRERKGGNHEERKRII